MYYATGGKGAAKGAKAGTKGAKAGGKPKGAKKVVVQQKAKKSKKIKIVLTDDVQGLGVKGEDVEVARGYARNYLFPRKLGVYCTEENLKLYEEDRANIDYAKREKLSELIKAKKRLAKVEVIMKRQVVQSAPQQVLHAPVSASNIAEKLWLQHKVRLSADQIDLPTPLSQIGTFTVPVQLEDLDVALKVRVTAR